MTPPRRRPRRGAAAPSDGSIAKKSPPKKSPTKSSAAKKKTVPTNKKVDKKRAQPTINPTDALPSNTIVIADTTVKNKQVVCNNNSTNAVDINNNIPLPAAGIIGNINSTITTTDASAWHQQQCRLQ